MTTRNSWVRPAVEAYLDDLLIEAGGNVARVVRDTGIPIRSLWVWIKRSPVLRARIKQIKKQKGQGGA